MRAGRGRLGIAAVGAIVQLAALVLAHDLVYLARYGSRYGEALVHSGHGSAWQAAVASTIVLGSLAATVVAVRLLRLRFLLLRARATGDDGLLERRALLRTWVRVGPALAIATAGLLTVQENLEQLSLHGTFAGPGILLAPEYAGGLWIALAVGLVVGLVVALVAWRLRVLVARLRAAYETIAATRVRAVSRPRTAVDRPASSILGRRSALRAPPVATPAS